MNDPFSRSLLLVHLASTLFMIGVIWFVQVVHYPLMGLIAPEDVSRYEQAHTRLTMWMVGPPMLAELASGVLLLWIRPAAVSSLQAWTGIALLAVTCCSTQFVQIPCHARLSQAFDPAVHRRLVRTNWVRTVAWSLRGLLVLWMLWNVLM